MKFKEQTYLPFLFFIAISIYSCSSNEQRNTQKKLTQIITQSNLKDPRVGLGNIQNMDNYTNTEYLVYDNKGNIIEVNDKVGFTIRSYKYDSSNKLITLEYNKLITDELIGAPYFPTKIIYNITYNEDDKISNIKRSSFSSYIDFSSRNYDYSYDYIYSNNTITKISNDGLNTKIEYGLSNNLVTSIKLYDNEEIRDHMTFNYDSEGNCISSLTLVSNYNDVNINIDVTYGSVNKNPYFNNFFEFEILVRIRAFQIRQALIDLQGTKYPELIKEIYDDRINLQTYEYSFDSDGFPMSKTLNIDSNTTIGKTHTSYTWE